MAADLRHFPNTPLVGQPLAVLGWTLILNVRCQCDRPSVVMLMVKQTELGQHADVGICPSCARPMHITNLKTNGQGLLEFSIDLGEPSRPQTDAAAANLTTN